MNDNTNDTAVNSNADSPAGSTDQPPTTTAYLVLYGKKGSYSRYGVVNAYSLDQAWAFANANVAGTAWTVVRITVQPVYTGNSVDSLHDVNTSGN